MNNKTRKQSPMVVIEKISPNKTNPRNKIIRRLTPHHVAGNLTVEAILGLKGFKLGGGASANYVIGSDGRRGLLVEEFNRAWTSFSPINDHEALTFEIANNGGAPDWRISDFAINSWLDLAVEICQFYGYKKVNYQTKPSNITPSQIEIWIKTWAKDDEMIITLHNWFTQTACPGPYFIRQLPWLVKEMNRRLNNMAPELFVGEGLISTIHPPSPSAMFDEYQITITTTALNVRSGPGTNNSVVKTLVNDKNIYTIVEEADGIGANKWGKLKSGLGWISLEYTKRR